jgi:hypothetical protein
LDKLLIRPGDLIHYQYDFGDSWAHTIRLETTTALEPATHARCIDGAGACPPEDCGGIMGYSNLLTAMSKPTTKAAKDLRAWLGYNYDPTDFCPDSVNGALSKLPWPSVTDKQLSRLIHARLKKNRPAWPNFRPNLSTPGSGPRPTSAAPPPASSARSTRSRLRLRSRSAPWPPAPELTELN